MDGSLQFHPGNSTLSGTLVMRFIMEGDAFVGRFGVKLPLHCAVVFDFQFDIQDRQETIRIREFNLESYCRVLGVHILENLEGFFYGINSRANVIDKPYIDRWFQFFVDLEAFESVHTYDRQGTT